VSLQIKAEVPSSKPKLIAKLTYGRVDKKLEKLGGLFGALGLPLMLVGGAFFDEHIFWIVPVVFLLPYLALLINSRRGSLWLERRGTEFFLVRDPYRNEQQEEISVAGIRYGWNYESIHHPESNGGLYRKADGSTIVPIGDTSSCGLTVVFYGTGSEKSVPKLALHKDLLPWIDNPAGWYYLPIDELLGVKVYPIYGSLKSFIHSIEEERDFVTKQENPARNTGFRIHFAKEEHELPLLNSGE